MLFVFVEGSDDERFFRHYYSDSTVKIVQYAHMSNKDLTAYLNSINAMQESDYIIITDSDGAEIEAKRKKFIEKHPCCEATKVFVSKREIESWYLAGFSQDNAEKYRKLSGRPQIPRRVGRRGYDGPYKRPCVDLGRRRGYAYRSGRNAGVG